MGNSQQYIFPDGGLYFGELNTAGLPESDQASCTWANGRSYLGAWANGTMSGVGTLYENGKKTYGFWWKGELLHEINSESQEPNFNPQDYHHQQQKITALLIGNCQYGGDHNLYNCIEDTKAIEWKLKRMGIDVSRIEDASKEDVEAAISNLCSKSSYYDHAIFFFSGHGCTYQGHHFLETVPKGSSGTDIVCLEEISSILKSANYKNRILIEDACNSILPVERGPISFLPKDKFNGDMGGTLMAFATGLGETSSDGIYGEHSPYARALLEFLDRPNMGLLELFNHVYESVVEYSTTVLHRSQEPWLYSQHIDPAFTLFPL